MSFLQLREIYPSAHGPWLGKGRKRRKEGKKERHEQGQPQCLKNVTITGFPSFVGKGKFPSSTSLGALEPIVGGEESGVLGVEGLSQEVSSCLNDICFCEGTRDWVGSGIVSIWIVYLHFLYTYIYIYIYIMVGRAE